MKSISNYEMDRILKKNNLFCNGIFNKDKLPEKMRNGFYICNMQDSGEGQGTHWVCFDYEKDKTSYYFDSFGVIPPKDIEIRLGKYDYNDKQIQDVDADSCGYYCLATIFYFKNKDVNDKNWKEYLDSWSDYDTRKNEELLQRQF
jgi:hypothetical protein